MKMMADARHKTIDGKYDFASASASKDYVKFSLLTSQLQAVSRIFIEIPVHFSYTTRVTKIATFAK